MNPDDFPHEVRDADQAQDQQHQQPHPDDFPREVRVADQAQEQPQVSNNGKNVKAIININYIIYINQDGTNHDRYAHLPDEDGTNQRGEEADSDGNDFHDHDDDNVYDDTYTDVLNSLSRKWLFTQLSHKVSAKAANLFWSTTLNYLPQLLELKEREGREKSIPQFIQQRRKLYKDNCPDVQMEFAFRKKDGSIVKHNGETAPMKAMQLNREYVKLYEMASIKVR